MDNLAARLKRTRKERGWSQPELAKKAGITQSFIAALETEAQQSSKYIAEIAHALGIDAYWLKTGVETVIAGDKRINEVVRLMQASEDAGRAVVLHTAREMAKEYPRSNLKQQK